jgi:hypothetical protein
VTFSSTLPPGFPADQWPSSIRNGTRETTTTSNEEKREKKKQPTKSKTEEMNCLILPVSFFKLFPSPAFRQHLVIVVIYSYSLFLLSLSYSLSLSKPKKKIIIIYFTTRHTNKNNQATTKEYRRDECDHRNPFPPFTHTHTHINVVFFNTNVYLVASIDYQDHTHPPHPPGVHFNTLCDYQQQPPNYSNKNGGGSNCFRASEKNKKKQKEAPSEFLIQKFNFSRAGGKKTKDSQYATLLSLYLSILLLYLYYTYTYYFSTYFVFWGGVPRSSCVGWFYVSAVYHLFRSCPKTS